MGPLFTIGKPVSTRALHCSKFLLSRIKYSKVLSLALLHIIKNCSDIEQPQGQTGISPNWYEQGALRIFLQTMIFIICKNQ